MVTIWEGQTLNDVSHKSPNSLQKRRKLFAVLIPILIVQSVWWPFMFFKNQFHLFTDQIDQVPRYYMSITMMFGSMVAGATSEGGGAIAFPVMTLLFNIKPTIARDFSFAIQSVGMTAAMFSIVYMRVKIEKNSVFYTSLGGIFGVQIGLNFVAPHLSAPYAKMYFVCTWFAFAISLFILNQNIDRKVYDEIPRFDSGIVFQRGFFVVNYKAYILTFAGFIGGVLTAVSGSGIDVCSFATLTLFFRVSEKTATPTSVILMAINASIGFVFRNLNFQNQISDQAIGFSLVCIPIVVVGAPLGSLIGSHLHRLVLASFVYFLDTIQLIGAFFIIQPWIYQDEDGKRTPANLIFSSGALMILCFGIFSSLEKMGQKLISQVEKQDSSSDIKRAQSFKKLIILPYEKI